MRATRGSVAAVSPFAQPFPIRTSTHDRRSVHSARLSSKVTKRCRQKWRRGLTRGCFPLWSAVLRLVLRRLRIFRVHVVLLPPDLGKILVLAVPERLSRPADRAHRLGQLHPPSLPAPGL